MTAFQAFVAERRRDVDQGLDRWLPTPPACPAMVAEAMRYSVMAGGKRLRPLLVLAAADAVAIDRADQRAAVHAAALPAACALEFIHTYSLVHDDLPAMDDDDLRRGRQTLHIVVGEGMAILAGDGLQAEAFALMAREPLSDDPVIAARKLRALAVVAAAAGPAGMVGGQAIDLTAAGRTRATMPALDGAALADMHSRKTGALIRAAATAGAIMGGGSDPQLAAIDAWAAGIGLAFQIVDDVLDVEGASADIGKTAGKDAAAGKPTYPALFGLERSRALAEEAVAGADAALAAAGLSNSHLPAIARWIVERRS